MNKTLRLILGDQLNSNHSWFKSVDDSVTYVMMEIRTETDYAQHHIQKVVGIFAAMQNFANQLKSNKHNLIYFHLNDVNNIQSFGDNIKNLIIDHHFTEFEYQLPDEYRVDQDLKQLGNSISIPCKSVDSEHFFTTINELSEFFNGEFLSYHEKKAYYIDGR